MTKKQATNLMQDLKKHLSDNDYAQNVYMSAKKVGAKIFKNCAYYICDDYTFIWTAEEDFILNKKEIGDFVIIPRSDYAIGSV